MTPALVHNTPPTMPEVANVDPVVRIPAAAEQGAAVAERLRTVLEQARGGTGLALSQNSHAPTLWERMSDPDWERLAGRVRRTAPEALQNALRLAPRQMVSLSGDRIATRAPGSTDRLSGCDWASRYRHHRARLLHQPLIRMVEGRLHDAGAFCDLADEMVDLSTRCATRLSLVGLVPTTPGSALSERLVATSALATAAAWRLGWSGSDCRLAALSGLLSDTGMLCLPRGVREAEGKLDDQAMTLVRQHPVCSVALLEGLRGIDDDVRRAVAVHHERPDGRGYPLGLRSDLIGELGLLVGACAALVGCVAPRTDRHAMPPWKAVGTLVTGASRGLFDRCAVRALVELLGATPVGSVVRLSDGRIASVVDRGAGTRLDKPVVGVWRTDVSRGRTGRVSFERIEDLAINQSELQIASGVEVPASRSGVWW